MERTPSHASFSFVASRMVAPDMRLSTYRGSTARESPRELPLPTLTDIREDLEKQPLRPRTGRFNKYRAQFPRLCRLMTASDKPLPTVTIQSRNTLFNAGSYSNLNSMFRANTAAAAKPTALNDTLKRPMAQTAMEAERQSGTFFTCLVNKPDILDIPPLTEEDFFILARHGTEEEFRAACLLNQSARYFRGGGRSSKRPNCLVIESMAAAFFNDTAEGGSGSSNNQGNEAHGSNVNVFRLDATVERKPPATTLKLYEALSPMHQTLLHAAAANVDHGVAILSILLDTERCAALINATDSRALAPLHIAIEAQSLPMVRCLLLRRADPQPRGSEISPLRLAIEKAASPHRQGDATDIVKAVFSVGVWRRELSSRLTPLGHIVLQSQQSPEVLQHILYGAGAAAAATVTRRHVKLESLGDVLLPQYKKFIKPVQLSFGALRCNAGCRININKQDVWDRTILHLAVLRCFENTDPSMFLPVNALDAMQCIKMLVLFGAKLDVKERIGYTALELFRVCLNLFEIPPRSEGAASATADATAAPKDVLDSPLHASLWDVCEELERYSDSPVHTLFLLVRCRLLYKLERLRPRRVRPEVAAYLLQQQEIATQLEAAQQNPPPLTRTTSHSSHTSPPLTSAASSVQLAGTLSLQTDIVLRVINPFTIHAVVELYVDDATETVMYLAEKREEAGAMREPRIRGRSPSRGRARTGSTAPATSSLTAAASPPTSPPSHGPSNSGSSPLPNSPLLPSANPIVLRSPPRSPPRPPSQRMLLSPSKRRSPSRASPPRLRTGTAQSAAGGSAEALYDHLLRKNRIAAVAAQSPLPQRLTLADDPLRGQRKTHHLGEEGIIKRQRKEEQGMRAEAGSFRWKADRDGLYAVKKVEGPWQGKVGEDDDVDLLDVRNKEGNNADSEAAPASPKSLWRPPSRRRPMASIESFRSTASPRPRSPPFSAAGGGGGGGMQRQFQPPPATAPSPSVDGLQGPFMRRLQLSSQQRLYVGATSSRGLGKSPQDALWRIGFAPKDSQGAPVPAASLTSRVGSLASPRSPQRLPSSSSLFRSPLRQPSSSAFPATPIRSAGSASRRSRQGRRRRQGKASAQQKEAPPSPAEPTAVSSSVSEFVSTADWVSAPMPHPLAHVSFDDTDQMYVEADDIKFPPRSIPYAERLYLVHLLQLSDAAFMSYAKLVYVPDRLGP